MNRKFLSCLAIVGLALGASAADAQDPNYIFTTETATVAPGAAFSLTTSVDSTAGMDVSGWSYGICHDPAALQLDSIANGAITQGFDGGDGPSFNNTAVFADGYTVGVVISLTGAEVLPPSAGALSIGNYTNLMADGATTTTGLCSTLGTPPVDAVVVVNGASIDMTKVDGTVTSFVPPITAFIRGDANADGLLNIADGIWMLLELFQGGPGTDCDGANDSNSDSSYDASDAVFVFNYQFLNGPAPAAPFPACGTTPGQTETDCTESGCP